MVLLALQLLTRLELKNGIKLDEVWIAFILSEPFCLEHSSLTIFQELEFKAFQKLSMDY